MTEAIRIPDLILLGRACPEPLADGRVTVCAAGWSAEYGFIRLYPTRPDTPMSVWDIIDVEVEKNPQDTRDESWKIAGSKGQWASLADKVEVVGRIEDRAKRRNILGSVASTCVKVVNGAKKSLGIIKPSQIHRTYFSENARYGKLYQLALSQFTDLDKYQVKRDFPEEPRVEYTCPDCQTAQQKHDQQILDWGFYEWFRKNPEEREQVWENAGFLSEKADLYFLVGNQRPIGPLFSSSVCCVFLPGLLIYLCSNPGLTPCTKST
ncbi:MAG: hypothetical protein HC915_16890 [Anaerolineae bacterium]|nr:hypothetical protein [Anaerolineae bacterium]